MSNERSRDVTMTRRPAGAAQWIARAAAGVAALCCGGLISPELGWAETQESPPPRKLASPAPAPATERPTPKPLDGTTPAERRLDRPTPVRPDAVELRANAPTSPEGAAPSGSAATPSGSPATPPGGTRSAEVRDPKRLEALEAYRSALRALRAEGPASPGDKPANPEAAQRALEQAKQRLLEVHRDRAPLPPEARAARDQKLEKALEEARKDRDERRAKRIAELEKAHGKKLERPEVRNELARHAWRVARLERLRQIAEAEGRQDQLERIQTLLDKERTQHEERLQRLAEHGPKDAFPALQAPNQPTSSDKGTTATPAVKTPAEVAAPGGTP